MWRRGERPVIPPVDDEYPASLRQQLGYLILGQRGRDDRLLVRLVTELVALGQRLERIEEKVQRVVDKLGLTR
jgi:hypothetical protein